MLAQQKKLDAMAFTEFTPGQVSPSPQLAEIYLYALTEPGVEEVGPHPRAAKDSAEPLLQLGDLFFKDGGHEVLLAINAACDLAYAPGTEREFPKDQAILLLHGQLQRFDDADTSGLARTELLKHDGRAYRILWDRRQVTARQYSEVAGWLREQGYSRKARLALPYALEVQQAFAVNLMRIGMPARPPMFSHADVEVYYADSDGNYVLAGDAIKEGALLISRKIEGADGYEDLFVLTLDCISRVVGRLDSVIDSYEKQKAQFGPEQTEGKPSGDEGQKPEVMAGKLKGVEGKLEKLGQLKQMSTKWTRIVRTPSALPASGERRELDAKLVWVYLDKVLEGKYREGPPIVLNLRSQNRSPGGAVANAQHVPATSVEGIQ